MDYVGYFSKITNHKFKDDNLLRTALTHSSYSNEHSYNVAYNERLEFLGDSVLSLVVSEYLYGRKNELAEGKMSKIRAKLVCESSLAECAEKIGLHNYLLLGKGEENTGGRNRPSIMADAMEAFIAALYIDAGLEKVREFVLSLLSEQITAVLSGKYITDYKTVLQEYVQGKTKQSIEYKLVSESGPDHNKTFVMCVLLDSEETERGEGRTKKDAQQAAAKNVLKRLGVIHG